MSSIRRVALIRPCGPPSPDGEGFLQLLIQPRCDHSSQCDGVDLRLEGIGAARQDSGDLGTGQDASVLYFYHMYDCFVYQVAGMDIREQQYICITLDLTVGSSLCLAASGSIARSRDSGPSTIQPGICPSSHILVSSAASTVTGILGFTTSTAARGATSGWKFRRRALP